MLLPHKGVVVYQCNGNACISGVLQSAGVWSLMSDLDDPELKELASQVPGTVLKSKAESSYHKM